MQSLEELNVEIEKIKARNMRVEADKAWEVSWVRRILISSLTYIVIVIFFYFAALPNPFVSALVPALAFVLSTLTISVFKIIWLKRLKK